MDIKIISQKRPVIEAVLNGKKYNFLLDTGASVGIIDKRTKGVHTSWRSVTIVDASGDNISCPVLKDLVQVGGKNIGQFILSDLSGVRESIRQETGKDITGIISYPQMQSLHTNLDMDSNMLKIS